MQNLFKKNLNSEIFEQLDRSFKHPGILLFRARELSEVNDYFAEHPLPIGKRILDLGCAEGYIGELLFNKIDVGLDLFARELKKAKQLAVYRNLIAADAKNIPFQAQTFDAVFSNSVIEHISGIEEVLREVSRVLCDQGIFIFTVPSNMFSEYLYFTKIFRHAGLSLFGLDKLYSKLRNSQLNHYNLFSDIEWARRLRENCLEIIYKKYYLSQEEMYLWDKICICSRLSSPLVFLNKIISKRFNKKVNKIITSQDNPLTGGGLLVVAKKRKK